MTDDEKLSEQLNRVMTNYGQRLTSAEAKADAAFLEVHGLAGSSGIKEEVAELRAAAKHQAKEMDLMRTSIKELGESLKRELEDVGSRIDKLLGKSIVERTIVAIVLILLGAQAIKNLMS
jgi:hypothetical protein